MTAPLTPEEIVVVETVQIERPGLSNIPAILPGDVLRIMKDYAARQTAALREELEAEKRYHEVTRNEYSRVAKRYREELEAVKKEQERAIDLLESSRAFLKQESENWRNIDIQERVQQQIDWTDKREDLLSSRENKKPDIIDPYFEKGMMEGH